MAPKLKPGTSSGVQLKKLLTSSTATGKTVLDIISKFFEIACDVKLLPYNYLGKRNISLIFTA
jgi:hypothetical protein